jgi:DNA-binding MarR family transcriptional regulator
VDRIRSFGYLLRDVSRLYVQRFEQRARLLGLTLSQSKALVYLGKHEGISQAQLSELAEIEPMNLCRILDRMEADGWMERRSDPADRRARRLYLKPKAAPLLEQIQELVDLTREESFAGIPSPQAELLIELLERVHRNIETLPPITVTPSAIRQSGPAAGRRHA